MSYEEKYLKYKLKYINLKEYKNYLDNLDKNETNILSHNEFINQTGGALPCFLYWTKRCKEKKRKILKRAAQREYIQKEQEWRQKRQAAKQDLRQAAEQAVIQAERQANALRKQSSIYEMTDEDSIQHTKYIKMEGDEPFDSVIDDYQYDSIDNPEIIQEYLPSGNEGNIYGPTSDGFVYDPNYIRDDSRPYGFGLKNPYT